jgi:hypothetical protein
VSRTFLALLIIALAVGRSDASPVGADQAAAEADALAKDGKFAAAAAKFREAWLADKLRPELFCNIGISYYKAKDLVRAHLLLELCLEQAALDPKVAQTVRTAVASVENVLRGAGHTPVRVVVEPSAASVAIVELVPDDPFVGSRVVWLPFGRYHLAAHAEGYVDATTEVSTSSAEPRTVTITLHKPVAIERDASLVAASTAPPSRLPAYLATGGAVLAFGVATFALIEGHARADFAQTALDQEALSEDEDAVSQWNTTLVIAGSVAIASTALGGYLWYRVLHTEPRIEVHAERGGAGVSFTGRF